MTYPFIILFEFVLYICKDVIDNTVNATVIIKPRDISVDQIPNSKTISPESPRRGPTIPFLPTSAHTVVAGWLRSAAATGGEGIHS
jgi:hypothetical protein